MERVRSGLRLPYDLNTWLIQEAKKQGVAKNALILQILWDWAKRQGKPDTEGNFEEGQREFAEWKAQQGK